MQAQYAPALLLSKLVGRHGTESLPGTIAPPPQDWTSATPSLNLSVCLFLSLTLSLSVKNNKLFGFTLVSRKFS